LLKEFQHFFETYKALKGKPAPVEIKGVYDKAAALEAVKKSVELYRQKMGA
jgi:inorganic pyrophosphatase